MKKIVTLIVIVLFVIACNYRTHECVKEISVFVEEQKENCIVYTNADWRQANLRFQELLIEANKFNDDLSTREKLQITRDATTYVFLQIKQNAPVLDMKELVNSGKIPNSY